VTEEVDVVVVGLGVGGEIVGGKLAEAGLSVVGVEAGLVGGECPYWGCIPSKMMIRAANLLAEARRVDELAGTASVQPSWRPVADRVREATAGWDDTAAVARFTDAGGRFVRGRGRLAGPSRVEVDDRTAFQASRAVVLAGGTRPVVPPIDGLADTPYWTNRDLIEAAELPESLLVLGGGAIGMELAQVYARYGVRVSVVEVKDRLVSVEEPESSAVLQQVLRADGVTIHTSAQVQRVSYRDNQFALDLGDDQRLTGQRLLVSTGRRADLSALGVGTLGLDPSAPAIEVDDRMRAGDRLWAVGDITGRGLFTHVATYQAEIAVRDILGQPGPAADYRALPRVTFTDPEIGAVGMTEAQARDSDRRVAVGSTELPTTARGWIHAAGNDGFIKLVADADRGVLVGATAAGPAGGEVLGALVVAVAAEVPVATLRHLIYAYPTFHRGISDALRDLDANLAEVTRAAAPAR
jgi:pyruvate/2-oxoglutarate dehydrogenase complex dihydrolipoamide dehydrogenase (E3) component